MAVRISIQELAGLGGPGRFTLGPKVTISHVRDARDRRGLLIAGKCVRLTMTDEWGRDISMLWSDEQWRENMREWAAVTDLATAPDKEPA